MTSVLTPYWGLTLVLVGLLVWLTIVDFRSKRIPDLASLPLIFLGLALSGLVSGLPLADRLIGAGAGFLLFWAIGEAMFRLRGAEALGLGDAKLFSAAGAWLGWAALPMVLLIAALMGLVFGLLSRRRELAFGPWLAAGFLMGWLQPVWNVSGSP